MKKYKLINTTIKRPRPHPRTGVDLRTMVEKVGHPVKIIMDDGKEIYVDRHRPRIVSEVNEGMMSLHRGKYIRIEEISEEGDLWKKHVISKNDDMFSPDEHVDSGLKEEKEPEKLAKVTHMGDDTAAKRLSEEHESSTNPDGDPNFLVKAGKTIKAHEKRRKPVEE